MTFKTNQSLKAVGGDKGAASPNTDDLQMLSRSDVADYVKISKRQISRWLSNGRLPPYDLVAGQIRRWRRRTIDLWMDERRKRAS